jgi:UDP-N-acetylglucosamine 2-epimerase (non-hydrolysing)
LRPNTERPITITEGTNHLVTTANLLTYLDEAMNVRNDGPTRVPPLWDGKAGERIADVIVRWMDETQ